MHSAFRRGVGLGIAVAGATLLVRAVGPRRRTNPAWDGWTESPIPTTTPVPPPQPTTTAPAWVEAVEGACPPGYPVKVKLTSGLYHEPGMSAYTRTRPDRCYATGADAASDGFRRALR